MTISTVPSVNLAYSIFRVYWMGPAWLPAFFQKHPKLLLGVVLINDKPWTLCTDVIPDVAFRAQTCIYHSFALLIKIQLLFTLPRLVLTTRNTSAWKCQQNCWISLYLLCWIFLHGNACHYLKSNNGQKCISWVSFKLINMLESQGSI